MTYKAMTTSGEWWEVPGTHENLLALEAAGLLALTKDENGLIVNVTILQEAIDYVDGLEADGNGEPPSD